MSSNKSVVSRFVAWDGFTVIVTTLIMIAGWTIFFTGFLKGVFFTTSWYDLASDIVLLMVAFGLLIYIVTKEGLPVLFIVYMLSFCLSLIVLAFSSFYWAHRRGFSHPLTHLDATYVALGTLAGGTGNILATQEATRAIQMTQEFVDLVFLLLVVGVALVPIAAMKRSKKEALVPTADAANPVAQPAVATAGLVPRLDRLTSASRALGPAVADPRL